MMLEDSVAKDLSRMQNRNPLISIPHTYESPVPPQEKYDSRKKRIIITQLLIKW